MTRQECLKAFEMRMDGKTWDEIGYELHYDEAAVRKALQAICFGKLKIPLEEKKDGQV